MTSLNLDKYWGVQLRGVLFDHENMVVTMDLFWTTSADSEEAKLIFHAVTNFELKAEKVFESGIVELVSLDAERTGDRMRVSGELSNYVFRIECEEVREQSSEGNCV